MPWTGKEFASRHNHKLKGAAADHAARQANAILRSGVPEGEAIAIANKHAAKGKTKVARLTSKERSKLPDSAFAGPGRSYPVEDKAHARAAKGFAAMHHAPNKAAIDAKADKVLGKGKSMKGMEHYAKGGTGPKGHSGGEARAKEMRTEHRTSNAKTDGMRHGSTKATGQMASRFDKMAKKSPYR